MGTENNDNNGDGVKDVQFLPSLVCLESNTDN